MGRGYTGGSLKRQAQPPEIAKSPHALCRTSVWRQSLVPKPQAIIQGQLPPREILPSSSSSLPIYCWHLSSALRKRCALFATAVESFVCYRPIASAQPAFQSGMSALRFLWKHCFPLLSKVTYAYRCTKFERRETHESVLCFHCCSRASVAGSLFVQPALIRARWVQACFSYFPTGELRHGYGVRRH
jgi:hypothetical protein